MPRVKCSVLDRNREKTFSRLATRGVVKFFNVCNSGQKDIETKIQTEAGSSMWKRDKILSSIDKGSFLDRLKETNLEEDEKNGDQNGIKENQPSWSVLRDDFIMGDKIKDWDKTGEEKNGEDEESNEELDSSMDEDEGDDKKAKPNKKIPKPQKKNTQKKKPNKTKNKRLNKKNKKRNK